MQCPICDKTFVKEDLFLQHIEDHKNNSILNKPSESIPQINKNPNRTTINIKDFFGQKQFEELIQNKIKDIEDVEELVHRRNFVEQTKRIISKNPFVYLPYLVDDLFDGKNSTKLIQKYKINNSINFKIIVKDILGFDRTRYSENRCENAFEMNLKIPTWEDKYYILKDNFDFFKKELLEITFLNVLRSFILVTMIDFIDSGISKRDIVTKARSIQTNYDIFKFIDDSLKKSFDIFFGIDFENMVQRILDELIIAKILKKKAHESELFVGKLSIDNVKQNIVKELKYSQGSQNEYQVRITVEDNYPSLRLMPGIGIWETAINELKTEKIIRPQLSPSKKSKILILNENYERIQQRLGAVDAQSYQFYGRPISPEEFIDELLELDRGDFDDTDDQVTRIAGLILAESVKLQPPAENIPEFDFVTDITNYQFRNEQMAAIEKLDFQINSDIFHCKVMLDEKLTLDKYNLLKHAIPKNEQGIVFTFKKISANVAEQLKTDKTIQVINEEGLKIWVSITSQIPARKNSIAKLHYDPVSKTKNKIVKVTLIDYETNLASVSILPSMQEIIVFTGSLEEISISKHNPMEFESYSKIYLDLLHLLCDLAPDTFEDGMYLKIIDVHYNHTDLLKALSPKWFVNARDQKEFGFGGKKYFQFDNVYVTVNKSFGSDVPSCTCSHKINEEHYWTLCIHQVATINYILQEELNDGITDKIDILKKQLLNFQENNIHRMISTISDVIHPDFKHSFKRYLQEYARN